MRGRAAERADGRGAMDGVAAAEEYGIGHRAAVFAHLGQQVTQANGATELTTLAGGKLTVRLNGAVNEALQSTDVRANFTNLGIEPRGGTPEEFATLLAQDAPRWFDIIRTTGIKLE